MLAPCHEGACPARDRHILHMRFVQGPTQKEIGDAIGVTQMQASRLLKRILDQLRSSWARTPYLPEPAKRPNHKRHIETAHDPSPARAP